MEYYFSVAGLTVRINYDYDYITNYLDKEFSLLKSPAKKSLIVVKIKNGSFVNTSLYKKIGNTPKIVNNSIVQYFTAFQRHFGVEYSLEGEAIECELFIPYSEKGGIKKFMSPFYEGPLFSCLADFFHNPFLAVLQFQLLLRGGSLFHCSSFYLDNENRTVVLAGGAGSGKSTLMTELLKKVPAKVCSEDFAVVSVDGSIYGYPHQTRVRFTDMRKANIKYKSGIAYGLNGILDAINKYFYSVVQHKENGRHFSLKEIYGAFGFQVKCLMDGNIYFLTREVECPETSILNLKEFCCIQTDIILTEFNNMISAMEVFRSLAELGGKMTIYNTFRELITNIYIKSFSKLKCVQVGISYMPNLDDATNELNRVIFKH